MNRDAKTIKVFLKPNTFTMTVCTSMQEDQFNHCFQHPTAAVWGRFYTIKAAQRKEVRC